MGQRITISAPDGTLEQLKRLAHKAEMNVSEFIRHMCIELDHDDHENHVQMVNEITR